MLVEAEGAPALDRGDPLGGVGGAAVGADGRVDDRPSPDDRHLQEPGQPRGEVGSELGAPLGLGDRIAKREHDEPSRYIVHNPPQQNKEGADRKAGELRKLGVREFYVIQDGGDRKWGISLGIFRTEEAARAHLASLNQKGVRSARIAPYSAAPHKVGYQLRNLDAATRAKVEKIRADFPQQQSRECAAAA